MIRRLHWRDAEAAAMWLAHRPAARRTLLLLAQLPLVPEHTIERLAGLQGSASVYRCLRQLRQAGLVAATRAALQPGCAPQLLYLTDLGLSTVVIDQGVEPEDLARQNRLRAQDLVTLLPGLPRLVALYALLAALVRANPGQPNLIAWQRPWRRRYYRPTAKAPVVVALPAYAAFAWEDTVGAYLLLPDLGGVPLRVYRPMLDHLLVLRGQTPTDFPTLVIATTHRGRAAAWWSLAEDARRGRSERPLAVCVATWDEVHTGLTRIAAAPDHQQPGYDHLVQHVRLRSLTRRRPAQVLPALVNDVFEDLASPAPADTRGRIALELTASDRTLLDLIGRHPFVTAERLAVLLRWGAKGTQQRLHSLLVRGLARRLEAREVGPIDADLDLIELTAQGLALAAAQQGLSLSTAVRYLGLAGGGPDRPIGVRRQLVANLAHTLGADGIFVRLARCAHNPANGGSEDSLVEWQNSAACTPRPRPAGRVRHLSAPGAPVRVLLGVRPGYHGDPRLSPEVRCLLRVPCRSKV